MAVNEINENIWIFDHIINKCYKRGELIGKGKFSMCYKVSDSENNEFAMKVISKKERMVEFTSSMLNEIVMHRDLVHRHIVRFHHVFEDSDNIYMFLHLCNGQSMIHLLAQRGILTEPEARYYLSQLIDGIDYLHSNRIIHRDIKLGNIFLHGDLQVKIGDFGIATTVNGENDRKYGLCGTANYIAPEIIARTGYSYEVDIWSLGCTVYTLLMGTTPFVAEDAHDTFMKISKCNYKFIRNISNIAKDIIQLMLQRDPKMRPTIKALARKPFMLAGYIPKSLPRSCLRMVPDSAVFIEGSQNGANGVVEIE